MRYGIYIFFNLYLNSLIESNLTCIYKDMRNLPNAVNFNQIPVKLRGRGTVRFCLINLSSQAITKTEVEATFSLAHTSVKNCEEDTSSHFSFLFTKPIAAENNMTDDIPTHLKTREYAVKFWRHALQTPNYAKICSYNQNRKICKHMHLKKFLIKIYDADSKIK